MRSGATHRTPPTRMPATASSAGVGQQGSSVRTQLCVVSLHGIAVVPVHYSGLIRLHSGHGATQKALQPADGMAPRWSWHAALLRQPKRAHGTFSQWVKPSMRLWYSPKAGITCDGARFGRQYKADPNATSECIPSAGTQEERACKQWLKWPSLAPSCCAAHRIGAQEELKRLVPQRGVVNALGLHSDQKKSNKSQSSLRKFGWIHSEVLSILLACNTSTEHRIGVGTCSSRAAAWCGRGQSTAAAARS